MKIPISPKIDFYLDSMPILIIFKFCKDLINSTCSIAITRKKNSEFFLFTGRISEKSYRQASYEIFQIFRNVSICTTSHLTYSKGTTLDGFSGQIFIIIILFIGCCYI